MGEGISRREFVKKTVAVTTLVVGAPAVSLADVVNDPVTLGKQVVGALGAVFIPSASGDPGYRELESHGITDYVLEKLPIDTAGLFNSVAQQFFAGKSFLELNDEQRAEFVGMIVDGSKVADDAQRTQLQAFYRSARTRILSVFYKNYPEHAAKRDGDGIPILKPGDTHQYTNPNTKELVTGWDIAGFKGPPDWNEEEQMRARAKKQLPYWYEGDLVKLSDSRPPASAAIKTSDGYDYYDVIVIGGGTAGCIVAGRLAEQGMNPKTGDRLRVAVVEGGDDWTIRDPGLRPGYGYPIRRQMITNIPDGIGPEGSDPGPAYRYPDLARGAPAGYNFRMIGGCSLHYGGTCWIPGEDDFYFYRQASGVDWDEAKFGAAIQEVEDLFHVMTPPEAWWNRGNRIWADGGRALGFEMYPATIAFRNPLGTIFDGESLSRCDSKGTSLPWAYIGLNNGLKVIANAEVQKIIIEKISGGRPLATGAIYKDRAGQVHEVRAARVVSACSANWTPLLMYKSGYGPKEFLGDKLLVENKNIGMHMTGDFSMRATAFLEEQISPAGREGEIHDPEPWTSVNPKPWRDLSIQIRGDGAGRQPESIALGPFAPEFGWRHKEYMRNGSGVRHIMGWAAHLGALPWSWRVRPPDGEVERVELDAPRVNAAIKQSEEVIRAWMDKLSVKVLKSDFRQFHRPATSFDPRHVSGTARAGSSPENSVCTSDFDCHDIEHLLFTSSATIPRTFFWSLGPTAVNACYGYRRMIENHFSRGCSTKGFA